MPLGHALRLLRRGHAGCAGRLRPARHRPLARLVPLPHGRRYRRPGFAGLRAAIRKQDPQALTTCKLSPFFFLTDEGNPQDAHPTHGVDFEALTELLDLPGMDGDMQVANEVRYGAHGGNRYARPSPWWP